MAEDLGVRIDAQTTGYEAGVKRAERATKDYERALEQLDGDLKKLDKQIESDTADRLRAQHEAYDEVGRGMVVAGAAMLVGAGYAAGAAMKWESAWAGVEKTVDGTPEQMAQLEKELRGLALTLPATHEEIAGVAEAAGQLGIAREDIRDFTKVMIDLGESTNLTSEEAATGLARMMNIMGTAPDNVDRMGAALVDLGNKGASTEAEILEMSLRIAGAGRAADMSEAQVLAIANALSSLGINAEAGGSAVSSMILKFDDAVDSGSALTDTLAEIADMPVGKFSELWQKDSAAGFEAVIAGLNRIKSEGGNVNEALKSLGVTEIRQRDLMLRLAGSGDLLATSLNNGKEAWRSNTALVEEAARRYATTESRVQVAKNQMNDFAIDVGEGLLPIVGRAAEFVGNLARAFGRLPGPVKSVIGPATLLLGMVTLLGGAFMLAVPKVAAFNAALASGNLGAGMQRAGNAAKGFAGFLMGPWGAALGVAAVGLSIWAANSAEAAAEVEEVTATLDKQSGALTENTQAWAINRLQEEGALDAARKLGIDLGLVTDAAMGSAPAISALNDEIQRLEDQQGTFNMPFSDDADMEGNLDTLEETLGDVQSRVEDGKKAWADMSEAERAASSVTGEAAGKQRQMGSAVDEATGEMQDQVSTADMLKEALNSLNNTVLNQRAGARAYQESLDAANQELRQGARTLNIHTKEGRENEAALDQVASETLRWAEALLEVDGSGRRSLAVMRQGREDLFRVARAFGMSRREARNYVDQVLQIPPEMRTNYSTPGSGRAKGEARGVEGAVKRIPDSWITKVAAETGAATGQIRAFVTEANRNLGNINNETVTVTVNQVTRSVGKMARFAMGASKDGGPIGYADGGGPAVGPGSGRDDLVPTWLSHGEHVFTAAEVAAAGGHGAMYALRRAALAGEVQNGRVLVPYPAPTPAPGGRSGPSEIVGTLHIPGLGQGYIKGIIREELGAEQRFAHAQAGRRR